MAGMEVPAGASAVRLVHEPQAGVAVTGVQVGRWLMRHLHS